MKVRRGLTAGILLLAVLASAAFVACGGNDDDDANDVTPSASATAGGGNGSDATSQITIQEPWARPSTNAVSAVYFVVKNAGSEDRLVSATADVSPKVQIHEVVTDGMSQRMQEVTGGIVVPANGSVELKPGGYHVMLMNLPEPLEVGDVVKVALTFEHAGTIDIDAPVHEAGDGEDDGHMHGHAEHGMQGQAAVSNSACSPTDRLAVKDQWARPSTNDVSAVFLVIENGGAQDRLLSATSDVTSKVQVHEVVTEGSSMRMQEVAGGIVVPAHECVELRPGGYHVMLMQLTAPLVAGDVVHVTLTFEHAGDIMVAATVRDVAEMQGSGGHMQGGQMQGGHMQHGGGHSN